MNQDQETKPTETTTVTEHPAEKVTVTEKPATETTTTVEKPSK